MKILHLAQNDHAGAGRAAQRLHMALLKANIDSTALVASKESELDSVVTPQKAVLLYKSLQSRLSIKVLNKFFGRTTIFSVNATPSLLLKQIKSLEPDIINIHWIGGEFFQIEELQSLKMPLVWRTPDMWPFTGGCHYSDDCDRYTHSCGACPQLSNSKESDLSRWVWQRKAKALKKLNLTIVSPSNWLAHCARASSLFKNFRIEVIPNGLDIHQYKPIKQEIARDLLNLPQNKQLVMFGAFSAVKDKRKGFHLLIPALEILSKSGWGERLELVVFGSSKPSKSIDLGFKTRYLGRLHDYVSLALAYSAADVMIVPSVQEAFGQTASESLACGTPVVAFNGTGLMDIVDHQQNGYLVKPYEIEDLARGIAWVLEDKERHQQLRHLAREKAEKEYSLETQAQRYLSLYKEILAGI